jgi:hypothetical protein
MVNMFDWADRAVASSTRLIFGHYMILHQHRLENYNNQTVTAHNTLWFNQTVCTVLG